MRDLSFLAEVCPLCVFDLERGHALGDTDGEDSEPVGNCAGCRGLRLELVGQWELVGVLPEDEMLRLALNSDSGQAYPHWRRRESAAWWLTERRRGDV